MEGIPARLKALRASAVPKLSIRDMAAELGVPASTYAAYEDPAKFKKPILPLDWAKRFADVLEPRGVSRAEVLALAGLTGELAGFAPTPQPSEEDEWLQVQGAVAAGVWRAQSEWPAGERYLVRFGPSRYRKEERFAVRMEGLSMNRTVPPGSDLECLWIKFAPVPPKPGDLVVVERHAHDLVELTCKRLAMVDDEYVLLSESTEEEFSQPMKIGTPSIDHFADDEIRVVGIVLSAKLNLAPPNLDQRRFPS